MKTSIALPDQILARREAVKAATGYKDPYIYEHGLLPVEAGIAAAIRHGEEHGADCPHVGRYPSGRCSACFRVPPLPAGRTGAAAITRDLVEAVREMGPDVTLGQITRKLRVGYPKARKLLAAAKAASG